MARRAGEAFGAAVELLPPTGEIPAPDTVIQSPTPHPQDVAADFIVKAEAELLPLWIAQERASWVAATYITDDTELMAADAAERVMEFVSRAAAETRRFQDLDLSGEPVLARKLHLLRIANPLPAPADPARRAELARIAAAMQGAYGKARGCLPAEAGSEARCLPLGELDEIIGTSRDPRALADAWTAWHDAATPLKDDYARYVELANEGAREMGFENLGDLWKSGYDMSPEAFQAETERLWGQLEPFYRDLHCFVRGRLRELHGTGVVPADGPIPAHLLGNMWAQDWTALYDLLVPEPGGEAFDLTGALVDRGVDPERMVRYAEAFFVSLGLPALPETFWTRSMLTKPRDREVVCHASAWDIDWQDDLRIKMCIRINEEDFSTIHHELGHNYYQRAYKAQPTLFTNSANDGFHEALGDTISLSVTPAYLRQVQLMPEGEAVSDLNPLMRKALEKIAFLPFGLLIDRWRWEVFAGRVAPADFNSAWWELRRRFQGVAPPAARGADAFDPGAKYHIPANVPYTRYFLAAVLQFQFHRALCRVAGHQGPLHTCSIYGSRVAGERLEKMMAMGLSQPWPDALEVLTGEREMDASAIVEYFAPLSAWIREQNAQRGFACGW
ncbi:MAG: M2 family metallopeptidase [Deltaproteobacteria bacterium]|nr:M2 family metallopeptidase [Deltaproteobacteria bacterium]